MSEKIFCAPKLEDLILILWQCYPKQATDLMQFLSNPIGSFLYVFVYFSKRGKFMLKFIWNLKELRIVKKNLEKKINQVGGLPLPDFRSYSYRNTSSVGHRDWPIDLRNKLRNKSSYFWSVYFRQGSQWRKHHLFNKCYWKN